MDRIASFVSSNSGRFQKHVDSLTVSQRQFIVLLKDWVAQPRNMVVIVSGGPGTGKTYAVTETLNLIRCKQLRMAPTARVAQKIGGRTLHSALHLDWAEGSTLSRLTKSLQFQTDMMACIEESNILRCEMNLKGHYQIVVIDEIGMIPFWFAIQIIAYLFERKGTYPILVVAMGDKHQLRPVRSNENLFDIPSLRERFETHAVELTESKRFEPDYEAVVRRLCAFVDAADAEGMFEYVRQTFPVVGEIDSTVLARCERALAFRNSTVNNYNAFYLKNLLPGPIVRLWPIVDGKVSWLNPIDVKEGCLLFVTRNGCAENVNNGTPLVFVRYDPDADAIVCRRPKGNELVEMQRDKNDGQFPVTVGFAGTVHKFQGETLDENGIVINFDGSQDLNLVYTALSRVKTMSQILAIAL